ncbi:MAG: thioredoxin domain-containing protein [Hyphomonadaceae bacterium]|nr:thioredoxin domain-containing protein [Hyphomonadaceae bacterium]MCA8885963.1 thioredoxin domain-containing protein [Hyphomonadaceae bacterium]
MVARLFALASLVLFAAPAASAQTFNGQQQSEIRAIVREYLVNNPDVLREALDALAERNAAERWQEIRNDPRDFAVGPSDAAVTIVEFYDYRCAYCHHAMEWVIDLTRTRRDIRVVFKEFPILTNASMEAARAALAARPQGRYLQFHQGLMNHPLDQELTSADIDAIARHAGIDVTRMRRAMDDPEIMRTLEQNHAHAVDYNITGTPGFVINGELIPGFNQPMLEARIREAAREARTARR